MTDSEIQALNLKPRSLTEKRLVEIFATDKIQNNYKAKGRFSSSEKSRVLKRAAKYCKIKDCGSRSYRITKVYNNYLPLNFDKMNRDLYQFICPLVLSFLLNVHNKNDKIIMTIESWAKRIQMINNNYDLIKDDSVQTEIQTIFHSDVINDFCHQCSNAINYYIIKSFNYLQDAGLIAYRNIFYSVPAGTLNNTNEDKCSLKQDYYRQATEQEIKLYTQCIKTAKKLTGIENDRKCYYGIYSKEFRETLNKELIKGGIQYIFRKYEVYCVDFDKCNKVLAEFERNSNSSDVKLFNQMFINKLLNNANKRTLKGEFADKKEKYLNDYSKLCKLIIDHDTKYIKERLIKTNDNVK